MPLTNSKLARLLRQKWSDPEKLAQEIVEVLKDAAVETSTTSTSTTAASETTTLSGSSNTQAFTLVSPHYEADYLQCTDANGNTVYIAKPYLFRPSVWQGLAVTILNASIGTRLGTLTIEYGMLTADENQRQVNTRHQLNADLSDVIETSFTESILPFYKVGDVIYGQRFQAGFSFAGGDGDAIQWLDLNIDGRTWQPDASLQVS